MSVKKYRVKKVKELDKELQRKLSHITANKLYITEEKLRRHLSENEFFELLRKGVLEDSFFQ